MRATLNTLFSCILIGLTFGVYLYFSYDHRLVRIVISLISSISIGSLMMLTIYNRHYFTMISRQQPVKMLIMILLLIAAALAGSEITLFASAWLTQTLYRPFTGSGIYVLNILIAFVAGVPIYVSEEWKGLLNSRLLNQQYRVLQLEQQQTAFELELLRAKINPHFLYNVHNSIAGLISKDPVKAEEMVMLLSKFFRFTLNKDSSTYHSVADELDIVKTYLNMQQIRYEKKLSFQIHADSDTLNLPIPSFILQPIVENAVKHGIETSIETGVIAINIESTDQYLQITVADSGPPFPDQPGSGAGLKMVLNKLKLLYGDEFKMELINSPEKHVRFVLPKRN